MRAVAPCARYLCAFIPEAQARSVRCRGHSKHLCVWERVRHLAFPGHVRHPSPSPSTTHSSIPSFGSYTPNSFKQIKCCELTNKQKHHRVVTRQAQQKGSVHKQKGNSTPTRIGFKKSFSRQKKERDGQFLPNKSTASNSSVR